MINILDDIETRTRQQDTTEYLNRC